MNRNTLHRVWASLRQWAATTLGFTVLIERRAAA